MKMCLRLAMALILPLASVYAETSAPELSNPVPSPDTAAVPANLSPGVSEVMRLAEAGTSDDVILGYIQNSTSPFNLNADQILYLRDNGLCAPAITAMLNRDNALRGQTPPTYAYDQKLYAPSAPTPPQAAPILTPPLTPQAESAPEPAQAPAPVYVSSPPTEVTYFYNDLSPYGTWVQLGGVGWCWQPRVVAINRGWQPYCDAGHWVYTDAGWYWQSDYSWGWAPFHYGRWHQHPGCGWVWVPDRVWAPAWVVWRSKGDYCGWAPLPPHAEFVAGFGWHFNGISVGVNFDFGLHPEHYTFIALHDFHEHDYAHRRLPPTQVTQIYNHTTIINNYAINNNTIVNHGIKVERVAAATHSTIRPVQLRDAPANAATTLNSHSPQKGELMVYRPQLEAPTKSVAMVAQKVDEHHPVIQHQPVTQANARPVRTANLDNTPYAPASGNRPQQAKTPQPSRPNQESSPSNAKPWSSANSHSSATSAATHQAEPQAQVSRSGNAYQSEPNTQLYPLHSGHQNTPNYGRPGTSDQGLGSYYPKSYHQAAEAHSLPQANSPQGERSSPPTSVHGQSKKNDQ